MTIPREHRLAPHLYTLSLLPYPFTMLQQVEYAKSLLEKNSPFAYLYDMDWNMHTHIMVQTFDYPTATMLQEDVKIRNGLRQMHLSEG